MDMQHVLGRTWAAEGATALLPLYFLSEKDVILIDTGLRQAGPLRSDPSHR